ncbi:uridine kinase [Suhomyces tanzawaensis NRRL Y-17324]|uniref:Uridine kinase n=1 Tax=Suhomyces tanzawaensis NRRL Y-17324 TaxID=984487 RepID=A0A1E4SI58_9ASCO|nr:uridine kinase [Suhomyces tanzawaensis NRRL Y-17324]ODV79199.1 uridine kinase [Suhomyces tanzawaensis NRRL Y-17324]
MPQESSSPLKSKSSRIAPDQNDSSFFESTDNVSAPADKPSYIPPWTEPYIIGVAGNSGSGKTSVSQKIIQELNQPWTVLLSFDNFYNPLNAEERQQAFDCKFDFDTPESFDMNLMYETVKSLKQGKKTEIPVYSFKLHNRTSKKTTIYGANVIIIEGIYALHDQRLLDLMDIKLYVDTDLDVCLARRLTRDILYRGRDLEGAVRQWETFVKPNAVKFVLPTMNNADLVLPKGLENDTAISLMIQHIQKQLSHKSSMHLNHLKALGRDLSFDIKNVPNLKLLPLTNQTRGIHSILFDQNTERSDFIFYFDRMCGLIIEKAQEFLTHFDPVDVTTQANYTYKGLKVNDEVIAVNIIRSGDCFMNSIKKTFPEILIGKLLIQSDSMTGEPQLHYDSLPPNMTKYNKKILLFDSQIISGAASIMAIQVLLDHRVKEEDIILCTYLSTEVGLRRIKHVFPSVNVVIGKLSSMEDKADLWYNEERFKDSDWLFRNRFIDGLYFGTR